jgi:hypothetical protein
MHVTDSIVQPEQKVRVQRALVVILIFYGRSELSPFFATQPPQTEQR